MFKRIVVAVDSSETGELALETAIRLALDLQARLRIVHAVDTANINLGAEFLDRSSISASLVKTAEELLAKAQQTATAAGVEVETGLLTIDTLNKRIPEVVVEDADAWLADVIVVGTHGRRGLSRLFLGSVAEGLVRLATTPVLLIRGG
jgi:nucleotide-binding universal stress UspA family protein